MSAADRLREKLLRLGPACGEAAESAVKAAAEKAAAEAAALAPVATGRLRGSVVAEIDGLSASVSAGCDYAAPVELGSRGRPARPFLLPAAQASDFPAQAAALAKKAIGRLR